MTSQSMIMAYMIVVTSTMMLGERIMSVSIELACFNRELADCNKIESKREVVACKELELPLFFSIWKLASH